jgi:hypothetical protein
MQQLLHRLSPQDQKLYGIILRVCGVALVIGLLIGLISFNGNKIDATDNWQTTVLAPAPDSAAEFVAVSNSPRWFREKGAVDPEQVAEEAKKAIEGQPESLKLIGIVERNNRPYALFIPIDPTPAANGAPKGVLQFAAGDVLVGDWVIKEITVNTVQIATNKEGAEQQTRELLLYQTKK